MKRLSSYFKIVLILLFFIGNGPALALENFDVGFNKARIIKARYPVDSAPVLYVQRDSTYLDEGKSTKIKIDASRYFTVDRKISYPTQIKIIISKKDPTTSKDIWLRTSTKTVRSVKHAASLFLDLDLGSYLSTHSEEFSFKLYDEKGLFIQEYNQEFIAENFDPDFEVNSDEDFTSCAQGATVVECIYETLSSIMVKPVSVRNTENYFARNSDGSLVMTVSTLDSNDFKRKKNKSGSKKKKRPKKKGNKSNSNVDDSGSLDVSGITKFSTITNDASHYHGYTEHLGKYTLLATSWDASHLYKTPGAYGNYSAVFGRNNKTSNSSIIAGEDNFTTAYSAVFGRGNIGNSSYSLIAGQDNYVDSSYALVSGKNNEVENSANSLVVGYYNNVNGEYASSVGYSNKIQGRGSHIWGSGITINGEDSFAFGFGNPINHTVITGDKKTAFVYGSETLLLVDGINGSVQIGSGGPNGAALSGFFNGTFVGDGSGLYNLDPTAFSGVVPPDKGGTGVVNTGNYTWGSSNVSIMNNHNLIMRLQGATDITLPTTGTLSTTDGIETFTNKTIEDATFTNSITIPNCSQGDFLLANTGGVMQCTNFATAVGSSAGPSFTPLGSNGSIQYKLNGVLAGSSSSLRVSNNGNGLIAERIETPHLNFPGTTSVATGLLSFSNQIDFDMTVNLDDSFIIPSCTTAGYILVNDVTGKFSCVDPSTVVTGGGNGGSAVATGVQGAIQFNNNGSFAADSSFRFENGGLAVDNIYNLDYVSFNNAELVGDANFRGRTYFHDELRFIDGNEGAGKVLIGDANGSISWVDASSVFTGGGGNGSTSNGSSLVAAGMNGSIQFNDDGALGADHTRLQYTEDTLKAQAITAVTMTVKAVGGASVSIDWSEGNQQELRLTQDTTSVSVLTNPAGPTTVMMQIVHNGNVGVKTINWPGNFMFSDGSPPILSTAANAIDFVSCFYNPNGSGTYFCQASYNFF
jgi:hypothetical protein